MKLIMAGILGLTVASPAWAAHWLLCYNDVYNVIINTDGTSVFQAGDGRMNGTGSYEGHPAKLTIDGTQADVDVHARAKFRTADYLVFRLNADAGHRKKGQTFLKIQNGAQVNYEQLECEGQSSN